MTRETTSTARRHRERRPQLVIIVHLPDDGTKYILSCPSCKEWHRETILRRMLFYLNSLLSFLAPPTGVVMELLSAP